MVAKGDEAVVVAGGRLDEVLDGLLVQLAGSNIVVVGQLAASTF